MSYQNTTLHWVLAKFLKDSLEFLSKNPRAKGMKRMDWINEWLEKEYPKTILWLPRDKKTQEDES